MKKIMLAVSSQIMGEGLQERLEGRFQVVLCLNADEAVKSLVGFCPDVLLLDLMIAGMDSFSILQAAMDVNPAIKTVAFADYIGPYTASMLQQMNVCHLLKIPCNCGQLAARITDIALWENEEPEIFHHVRNILGSLGFKMNTEGYRITETAIIIFMQDPRQPLSAQLYPAVAKVCGGNAAQVEKAIRTCVESAWKNGNEDMWRLYFAPGKGGKVQKPSNGEFLAKMAACLNVHTEEKGEFRQKIG